MSKQWGHGYHTGHRDGRASARRESTAVLGTAVIIGGVCLLWGLGKGLLKAYDAHVIRTHKANG